MPKKQQVPVMAHEDIQPEFEGLHIDQAAAEAARLAREVQNLEREMDLWSRDLAAVPEPPGESQLDRLRALRKALQAKRNAYHDLFTQLDTVIRARVHVPRRVTRTASTEDDVLQDTMLRVFQKFHTYDPTQSTLAPSPDGQQVVAWINSICRNRATDVVRLSERRIQFSQPPADVPFEPEDLGKLYVLREDLRQRFESAEEAVLQAWDGRLRSLMLFVSGFWKLVSPQRRATWSDFPTPSDWQIEKLTAMRRANAYAQEMAEQRIQCQLAEDPDCVEDLAGEERRARQSVAQNLARHYWKWFTLQTAWMHLLAYVPPAERDDLDVIERMLDITVMAKLLYLDAWITLDRAARWADWQQCLGVRNRLDRNFLRVTQASRELPQQDTSPDEGSREAGSLAELLNSERLREVAKLVVPDDGQAAGIALERAAAAVLSGQVDDLPAAADDAAAQGSTVAEFQASLGRMVHIAAHHRQLIDLPLPFRSQPVPPEPDDATHEQDPPQ